MFMPMWPGVKPFAMTSGSQFRPAAPIALTSAEWATEYNEIKSLGRFDSTTRTAKQTEDARFWLATGGNVYYPVARSLAKAKNLNLIESARLFALVSVARLDATIAVFDAKYQYGFWRPITAIRNGDIDDNPATELDATWRPIADTPMHPEYPCAHCIFAASMAGVLEPDTARGHAPLDQPARLREGGFRGPHLRRLPLPLLGPHRRRHGPQDRRVCGEECDAADKGDGCPLNAVC
jgi:hypothetical protein